VPTLFHGTGLDDAPQMATTPGRIDVTRGGGEFGRGFYTQYAEYHALAWAIRVRARLNGAPCVLRLDIEDAAYATLTVHYLDSVTGPALTALLDRTGEKHTYVDGTCDLMEGPIMGNPSRLQQKFVSQRSEQVLNGSATTRMVV
jgi:hypothetical protein